MKLLLVEDQVENTRAAIDYLQTTGSRLFHATNYDAAISLIGGVDAAIIDLFFRKTDKPDEPVDLGLSVVEQMKQSSKGYAYGLKLKERVEALGVEVDERLTQAFLNLGYFHESESFDQDGAERTAEAVLRSAECTPNFTDYFLEIMESMLINKGTERSLKKKYGGLIARINESPDNQPLGYLVAQEAERRGKPFIIATSSAHSEDATKTLLASIYRKNWPLFEQMDKQYPETWRVCYEKVRRALDRETD